MSDTPGMLGHRGLDLPDLAHFATFWLDPFGFILKAVCYRYRD